MALKVCFSLFVITVYMLFISTDKISARSPPGSSQVTGSSGNIGVGVPRRNLLLSPHASRYGSRFSDGFVIRDDDIIELTKKQFDDYGHMRFGKREDQFDDYGHLRFGRADAD